MSPIEIRQLPGGTVLVDLHVTEWSEVLTRMAGAWTPIADAVVTSARAHPSREWDRLRAYARFASGLIWLSTDPLRPERNANVAGIKLECLEALYYQLPLEEEAAGAFERAHDDMSRRVAQALRASARAPEARVPLAALQRLRPHALTFVEYDDLETEQTLLTPAQLAEGERADASGEL